MNVLAHWRCPHGHWFVYQANGSPKWCPGCGTSSLRPTEPHPAFVRATDAAGAAFRVAVLEVLRGRREQVERLTEQHQGAVESIKALRGNVDPADADEREAAYAHGYLAGVTDALERLAGGQ